jgi:Flp pilus assembly protein TadD
MSALTFESHNRPSGLRLVILATSAALSACTALDPRLARDWTETNALVAARADHGGYLEAAHQMMAGGEYELALRGYTRAIAEDGLDGRVIAGLGAANLQLDREGQARTLLDRGTRIDPQSTAVWNNFGVALAEAGERRAAEDAFTVASSFAPQSDSVIPANLAKLKGKDISAAPASRFTLVRHKSGLYLLLDRVAAHQKEGTDAEI